MRLYVGPIAPASAVVWIEWAREVIQELRREPPSTVSMPAQVLDDVSAYPDAWARTTLDSGDTFRWHPEVDPDEIEYVTNAFYNLDTRAAAERGDGLAGPPEGRVFYLVVVRALPHALASEGPGRAAFGEQLRSSWNSLALAE